MTVKPNLLKVSALALVASFLAITSCEEESAKPGTITLEDTADLSDEAITEAYFQDLGDLASIAISAPSDSEYNGGRAKATITVADHRFCDGTTVTIVPDETSTTEHPKGVLTVDFGAGCTDLKGNVRKGKLIFTYDGKRFVPESTVVTTTDSYYINDIRLEGTRTSTNTQDSKHDAPRFTVTLEGGKATFQGGAVATRESEITWKWERSANPLDDHLKIESGSWASGVTRIGRAYEVTVLSPINFVRHCGFPVEGIKKYTVESKEITIDYGDGDCDRKFTVTVNGTSREIGL